MPETHWLVPMGLYVLVAFIGVRSMNKYIVGLHSRVKRLWLQYLFCVLFAAIFALASGHFVWNVATWLLLGIGLLNGIACYAHWKAIDRSLSMASLFEFGDDIIAMSLFAYAIPSTLISINKVTWLGIAVCLLMAGLFALHAKLGKRPMGFFKYAVAFSVLWGVGQFSAGYSATEKLPVGQFLFSWYAGSLIAATFLLFFYKDPDTSQQGGEKIGVHDVGMMFFYSSGIVAAMGIQFWVYAVAPQLIIQPVFLIGEAVFPMIIGLLVFKEKDKFDNVQWALSVLGLLGITLIAFGS